MMENKKHPNDVLPKKIEADIVPSIRKRYSTMKGGEEMSDKKVFKKVVKAAEKKVGKRTPIKWGVDHKVYEGVRIGLKAAKARQRPAMAPHKTACLDVERWNQRIFTLPDNLSDEQAASASVALSGAPCQEGRDYTISGNILNWISDRNLYKSDVIAVRWDLDASTQTMRPSLMYNAVNRLEKKLTDKVEALEKKTSARMSEIEITVETLDDDYNEVMQQVGGLGESISVLEDASIEEVGAKEEVIVTTELEEEEDVIEPGVKVYHRLNDEGPWIVVQSTVLNITSRLGDGEDETRKSGFVENAWTVQTEDGVKDYPEVVLTTRKPKVVGMSLPKKIALGVAGIVTAAAVVHAPLLLKLVGLIQ